MVRKHTRKAVTLYLNDDEVGRLNYLIAYFDRPGSKAGITSVYRYALDELYRRIVSELSEKKEG